MNEYEEKNRLTRFPGESKIHLLRRTIKDRGWWPGLIFDILNSEEASPTAKESEKKWNDEAEKEQMRAEEPKE